MPTLITPCGGGGGGSSGLPYCEAGQFRSGVAAGGSSFFWTNAAAEFATNDPIFSMADGGTAIAISVEGQYLVNVTVGLLSGATTLTSDRTCQFEYLTDFGYTPGGGGLEPGSLVTGQPFLSAANAALFSEYLGLQNTTFWIGSLANVGLSALPLKIKPELVINNQSNPFNFFLGMNLVRIGDAAVF